jgi:hypothetical protein
VEKCHCPVGYEGLSCESCSYGYTRVNGTLFAGECRKCDCHGHVAICDAVTLKCGVRRSLRITISFPAFTVFVCRSL